MAMGPKQSPLGAASLGTEHIWIVLKWERMGRELGFASYLRDVRVLKEAEVLEWTEVSWLWIIPWLSAILLMRALYTAIFF